MSLETGEIKVLCLCCARLDWVRLWHAILNCMLCAVLRSLSLADTQLLLHLMQQALSASHRISVTGFPLQNHTASEGYNITDIMAFAPINGQMGRRINSYHTVQ